MLKPMTSEALFTTGKAAKVADVSQQTIIRWAREGLLKPSKPHVKTANRRYTLNDLVAGTIAQTSLEIGIHRKVVKKIVKAVQRADRDELEHARLFTAKSESTGMMRVYWCADDRDPEEGRYVEWCRDTGRMIDDGSLLSIVETTLKHISKMLDIGVLAGLSTESD